MAKKIDRKSNPAKWGDPMDYSHRHIAEMELRAPNRFICIRCLAQALTASIRHAEGCPEAKVAR